MKKKILFIIPSLSVGGAEKSLITLLTLFDSERYDTDLLVFRKEGLFSDSVPDKINVICGAKKYLMFDGDARKAILYFLRKFKIVSAISRYKYSKLYEEKDEFIREYKKWKYLSAQLPKIKKEYDCAIGYLEGNASLCAIENIRAKKRICYVHSDIKKLGINEKLNDIVFKNADKILTVSEQCLDSLKNAFPEYSYKYEVIENITSPTLLAELSKKETVFEKSNTVNLLTVGRFSEPKGIDLAVEACALLKKKEIDFKWYHLGGGPLKDEVTKLIKEKNVEDKFILLGEKNNPYPYMSQCDIYIQPSRYEGKSIAIDEVKCLCKPIVVTNFTTVSDQITDGVNGLICDIDFVSIANAAEKLINNQKLREKLSENLHREKSGNENEIKKLYKLIET